MVFRSWRRMVRRRRRRVVWRRCVRVLVVHYRDVNALLADMLDIDLALVMEHLFLDHSVGDIAPSSQVSHHLSVDVTHFSSVEG